VRTFQPSIIAGVLWRYVLSALSGLLLAASFPLTLLPLPYQLAALFPYNVAADPALGPFGSMGLDTSLGYVQFPWLAFIALVPLLLAASACETANKAFRCGYVAGLCWLSISFLWISNFGALPVVMLVLFFALPVGLFSWLAWWLIHGEQRGRLSLAARTAWGLPLAWTAIEYLRSFGFWSFPWNLLGYSQAATPLLLQTADFGGVYAVTFLITAVNAALFMALAGPGRPAARVGNSLALAAVVALMLGYGWWRTAAIGPPEAQLSAASGPRTTFGLVQGGMGSMESYEKQPFHEYLSAYTRPSQSAITLWGGAKERTVPPGPTLTSLLLPEGSEQRGGRSRPPGSDNAPDMTPGLSIDEQQDRADVGPMQPAGEAAVPGGGRGDLLLLWPESCLPKPGGMDPRRPDSVPEEIKELVRDNARVGLLFGAVGLPKRDDRVENGAILAQSGGRLSWPYSKIRLVPYGEVVPFRGLVKFLEYPWGDRDIVAGDSIRPVQWKQRRLGLLICFDNVFGFLARKQAEQGAQYLVLITNNSWYPMRSGVRQHCDLDIFRAIEVRRPLLRVSTTGWSQVIDRSGRVLRSTGAGQPGLIVTSLAPGQGTTPYLLVGDLFAQLALLLALALCVPVIVAGRSEGYL
jgi:apolipoprotein N-acyltransferase